MLALQLSTDNMDFELKFNEFLGSMKNDVYFPENFVDTLHETVILLNLRSSQIT